MARGFKVWTDFTVGKNQLGKTLDSNRRRFKALNKVGITTGKIFAGVFGANLATMGMQKLGMGIRSVATDFIDLDQSVTSAGARFGELYSRGTEGFKQLSDSARKIGADTEHTASQVAGGLNFMAMAGFNAQESIALLPSISDLATAANLDFATSSDVASDALGAFSMATGTAEQKASSFKNIVDQAASATNSANFDLTQWFEAVQEGAPSFSKAGQKMSMFNAMLGTLASAGKKGATAGVAIRNIMTNLAGPTPRATKLLKKMGVQVSDKDGNFRNFADILSDLKGGLNGVGEVKRASILKDIFGKRQLASVNILLENGGEALKSYAKQIANSGGKAKELADKMRMSIGNRIKKMKSQATELGIKLFDAFAPKIEKAITGVSNWLDNANNNSAGFIKAVVKIGEVISSVTGFLYDNRDAILSAGKAYLIFKAGLSAMNLTNAITGLFGLSNAFTGAGNSAVLAGGKIKGLKGLIGGMGPVLAAASAGYGIGVMINDAAERRRAEALKRKNKTQRETKNATTIISNENSNVADIKKATNTIEAKYKNTYTGESGKDRLRRIEARLKKDPSTDVYNSEVKSDVKWMQLARKRKQDALQKQQSGSGFFLLPGEQNSTQNQAPQFSTVGDNNFTIRETKNTERQEIIQTIDWGNVPDFISVGSPKINGNHAGAMP